MREFAREEGLEAKMKNILADIAAIDEKAKRLAKQREKLMLRYEELKDAKLIRDSESCIVKEDWDQGKLSSIKSIKRIFSFIKKNFVHQIFFYRKFRLVKSFKRNNEKCLQIR